MHPQVRTIVEAEWPLHAKKVGRRETDRLLECANRGEAEESATRPAKTGGDNFDIVAATIVIYGAIKVTNELFKLRENMEKATGKTISPSELLAEVKRTRLFALANAVVSEKIPELLKRMYAEPKNPLLPP